ncbi:DUF3047 domain-containing protein [Methylotuvimicrobium sp. KM2]|uniref:DUF3047 domain-containing protein n=1 Tax=Methylotuvimicrobium sp. KM2 TaxID=3133976 RepID=UPI00310175DB
MHSLFLRPFISRCLLIALLSSLGSVAADTSRLAVGQFSAGSLVGWKPKAFKGTTLYTIELLDDIRVLRAQSEQAASGLFKEQRIDLQKTPYLNWRWRIENRLGNIDEQSKSGDDYAARIYVVVSGGWAFWRTRAINYVWAGNSPKGMVWPNAFAGQNAIMIALRSADDQTATWYQEKRNVLRDLEAQFGEAIRYIDAVALMTDTDNAGGSAEAYYGDIYFSRD